MASISIYMYVIINRNLIIIQHIRYEISEISIYNGWSIAIVVYKDI